MMSERMPIEPAMLETYRGLAYRTMTAESFVWKLFGYIDWLEDTCAELSAGPEPRGD